MIAFLVLTEKIVDKYNVLQRCNFFTNRNDISLIVLAKSNLKATSLTFICDKSDVKTT